MFGVFNGVRKYIDVAANYKFRAFDGGRMRENKVSLAVSFGSCGLYDGERHRAPDKFALAVDRRDCEKLDDVRALGDMLVHGTHGVLGRSRLVKQFQNIGWERVHE